MKRVLVKIRDKSILMTLKQYGNVETVSNVFLIYAITVTEKKMRELKNISGIISVEEDETYTIQKRKSGISSNRRFPTQAVFANFSTKKA
jgi:hypothetical protein